MSSGFYLQGYNAFVGAEGDDRSKHAIVESIKTPDLVETTEAFTPGGSPFGISIGGLGLEPLELGIKIKGFDPQLASQFGMADKRRIPFSIYGAYQDLRAGKLVEMKCIVEGRLISMTHDEMTRGALQGFEFKIGEITQYQLWFDNKEKHYADIFKASWRVDGVSQTREMNNILRIPDGA